LLKLLKLKQAIKGDSIMGFEQAILAKRDKVSVAEITAAMNVAAEAEKSWRKEHNREGESLLGNVDRDTYATMVAIERMLLDNGHSENYATIKFDTMRHAARDNYYEAIRWGDIGRLLKNVAIKTDPYSKGQYRLPDGEAVDLLVAVTEALTRSLSKEKNPAA
jgi:hypothetical protein